MQVEEALKLLKHRRKWAGIPTEKKIEVLRLLRAMLTLYLEELERE